MKQRSLLHVSVYPFLLWGCELNYLDEFSELPQAHLSRVDQAKNWYDKHKQGSEVWLNWEAQDHQRVLFYTEPSWCLYYKTETDRYSSIDVALTTV